MIGEIIELLIEGETLRESFEDKGYCKEMFMFYSSSLDRVYCFACSLFDDEAESECTAESN